jgi:nitrogen fixation/metabolism regulation signal transduction histidine kinase
MTDEATRKLGHELRNVLSPAMMMAERVSMHSDPQVQRAGKLILDSLDKAIALIKEQQARMAAKG